MSDAPHHHHHARVPDHDHQHGGHRRRGPLARLRRAHHHGHTISDHGEATAAGLRATGVGLAALGATAAVQLAVVAISGSVALLADTIHNLSDALTAVPLGLAFLATRRRPRRGYTYGYGRAEDLAGAFVVVMIAVSAALAAYQGIGRLAEPRAIDEAGWVAAAGIIGFVGNQAVAVYRIRIGRRIGSAALEADGLHARTDALTSLAVLGAALGSLAGWPLVDPIVGLAISVAILNVLRVAARDVWRRLMDGVDPDLVDTVNTHLAATPGIRALDRTRVRWLGHQVHVEAEVVLDAQLALARAHDVLEDARHRLVHHVPRLADAVLHASPTNDGGRDPHALTRHHFPAA